MRKGSVRFFGTSDPQTYFRYSGKFRDFIIPWQRGTCKMSALAFDSRTSSEHPAIRISLRRLSIADACWDLQDYIPDCSTAELLVLTLQIKWRWVVHGSSSRLLFCYSFVCGELGPTSIAVASYQFTLTIIDLRCLRNVPGPAWVSCKTETQIYGKSASWTRARGAVWARSMNLLEAEHIQDMFNEMGGLCKSRRDRSGVNIPEVLDTQVVDFRWSQSTGCQRQLGRSWSRRTETMSCSACPWATSFFHGSCWKDFIPCADV